MMQQHSCEAATVPGVGNRRRWWAASAVAIFGALLVFFQLGSYRTLTNHEGFVAVIAREMASSGDWIVPRFGGKPWLEKPPLAYWSAAGSAWLWGGHSPWSARFPSAVAALLLAALIGYWAGRWYGPAAGLAAAVVQLTSVHSIRFARLAEVDMQLCLLTTLGVYLLAGMEAVETRPRRWLRWSALYGVMSLAWLAKFHYGPAMLGGLVLGWIALRRSPKACWEALNPLGWMLLGLAVVVWPYLLSQRVPDVWSVWQPQLVGRAVGQLGRQPWWFYFPHLVVQTLPWAAVWLVGLPASFRKAWIAGDQSERFLWLWFCIPFVLLMASASKHSHYLMFVLPMFSLTVGRSIAASWADLQEKRWILDRRVLLLAGLLLWLVSAVTAGVLGSRWPHLILPAVVLAVCLAVVGTIAVICLTRQRVLAGAVAAAVTFAGCYCVVMGWVLPGRDPRLPNVELAVQAVAEYPGRQICVYALHADPVTYYAGARALRADTITELQQAVSEAGGPLLVISSPDALESLPPRVSYRRILGTPPARQGARPTTGPLVLVELTESGPESGAEAKLAGRK